MKTLVLGKASAQTRGNHYTLVMIDGKGPDIMIHPTKNYTKGENPPFVKTENAL